MTLFTNSDRKRKHYTASILSIALVLLGWQLAAVKIGYPLLFPTLDRLCIELVKVMWQAEFAVHLSVTIFRGLSGFAVAAITAFLMAVLAYKNEFLKYFFQPLALLTRSVPVISLVLLLLLWVTPVLIPVCIAFITMFPILYVHFLSGFEYTDNRLVEMGKLFEQNAIIRFIRIQLPAARINIQAGIKTAMGFGWRAIIIGEVLAQPLHGIGTAMKQAQVYINTSELLAWTFVAVAVSYLFESIISALFTFSYQKEFQPVTCESFTPVSLQAPAIRLEAINKSFDNKILFREADFEFEAGCVHYIKGSSGIGKTTLLRIIAGLEKPDDGSIRLSKPCISSFSFQDIRLLPHLTVAENIAFGMPRHNKNNALLSFLLNGIGLTDYADLYPHQLSGGQQQRVGLARALAMQPSLLLLDEPLNGLDDDTKIMILSLLKNYIQRSQPTVIWATHEDISMGVCKEISIQIE